MDLLILFLGLGILMAVACYGSAANRGLERTRLLAFLSMALYMVGGLVLIAITDTAATPVPDWYFYPFFLILALIGYAVILGDRKWTKVS